MDLPGRVLWNDGERDNWSIDFGGEVIELNIPVDNRDAKVITAALLKAAGTVGARERRVSRRTHWRDCTQESISAPQTRSHQLTHKETAL